MLQVNELAYRWRLRRLLKRHARLRSLFKTEIDLASKARDWEKRDSIARDMFYELDMVDEEITLLQHDYMMEQARRLLIPVPELKLEEGDWRELRYFGVRTLTADALFRLARDVRQERRERIEMLFLVPMTLVGFIGGLAGLGSAFLSFGGW